MRHIFLACIAGGLLICGIACKNSNNTSPEASGAQRADVSTTLAGQWVDIDFCSRVNSLGSIAKIYQKQRRPLALALEFNAGRPDSVLCSDGISTWSLPIKINADTIEVIRGEGKRSVFLMYSPEAKDLTMFDATEKPVLIERFTKSKGSQGPLKVALANALNHNLLSGSFMKMGGDKNATISFDPIGSVNGLGDFNRYRLCVGGKCLPNGSYLDAIELLSTTDKNTGKWYGLQMSEGRDTLIILNLSYEQRDSFQVTKVGTPLYKLVKKKAEATPVPAPQPAKK
jgi:hypothetical protein